MMLPSSRETSYCFCHVLGCLGPCSKLVAHRTPRQLESWWFCPRAGLVPKGVAFGVPSFLCLWHRIWEGRYPIRFLSLHCKLWFLSPSSFEASKMRSSEFLTWKMCPGPVLPCFAAPGNITGVCQYLPLRTALELCPRAVQCGRCGPPAPRPPRVLFFLQFSLDIPHCPVMSALQRFDVFKIFYPFLVLFSFRLVWKL